MAEAIGLIASVIQVAGAGLKLSQSLYQYVDGVATADRRIKDIAKEIELTSFVIEELGSVFKQDETSNLISKNAVKTAEETMKECFTVFSDIDAAIKKSKKNTLGRLMLPFRDNKIELLRNHIDKLKSTLQLLMQVLTHAHQVASKKIDREVEAKQREEIKELLENNKRSTKRYEESLRNFSVSDASTIIDDEHGMDKKNDDPISTGVLAAAASTVGSTINPDTLEKCVQHIRDLLENIETLQQALSKQVDGDDHSEHHQSLIGSYFRARTHLDSVLFGTSAAVDTFSPLRGGLSTTLRVKAREIEIGTQKPNPDSKLHHTSTPEGTSIDAEFNLALHSATEKTRAEKIAEEREKIKQEAARPRPSTQCFAAPPTSMMSPQFLIPPGDQCFARRPAPPTSMVSPQPFFIPPGGSGVGVPSLSTAADKTFGSNSNSLPYSYQYSRCGPPRNLDTKESEVAVNHGDRPVIGADESNEVDAERLRELEVDKLLMEWTNVLG